MAADLTTPLVIGLGNRWCGDDALGPWVLDALRQQLASTPEPKVELLDSPGDNLTLINAWALRETVYLVDACYDTTLAPGSLITINNALLQLHRLQNLRLPVSSHVLDLAQTITISRAMGNLPQRLVVYAAVAGQFAAGTRPGVAIQQAVQTITDILSAQLRPTTPLKTVSPTILPG